MKKIVFILIMAAVLMGAAAANAALNVFACEPEWAALAKEIGKEKVSVTSATTARQDPHHIRAKPSLLSAMRKADMVVCSGAGLEAGWLPILLQNAGSAGVQPGTAGYLMAADHLKVMGKPAKVDRHMGDVHPEGNPHLHLNPHHIGTMARVLAESFSRLDAGNAAGYQQNLKEFQSGWQANVARWEREAASLKGMPVIAHHENWLYLNDWLGLKQVATLEPKPGIPPTASHLQTLLEGFKTHPAKAIIRTVYEDKDASDWLAGKTGVPAVMLPYTVGGSEEAKDLTGLFDATVKLLKGAAQ